MAAPHPAWAMPTGGVMSERPAPAVSMFLSSFHEIDSWRDSVVEEFTTGEACLGRSASRILVI